MAKSSDIIKIGFDYRASLEQFVKETNGVFDGISEKAGKQRISIQLDAKNDKVIEKIKELQKLKLDSFTFEFGESGLAEQLKTFDQLEKKITEIINLSKGINNLGSGNGIGNSIVDEKSLNSIIDLFSKMESHLGEMKKVFVDVGDGEEFSPLLKMIDNVQSSVKELSTSVSKIKLDVNMDLGSGVNEERINQKVFQSLGRQLEAYKKLYDAIRNSRKLTKEMANFKEPDGASPSELIGIYKGMISRVEQKYGKDTIKSSIKGYADYIKEINNATAQFNRATNKKNTENPLGDLFGKNELIEVVSQLGLIADKLSEISKTVSGLGDVFKNTFKEGLNVSASVEEIEKLTNRVKELEDELSKIKPSTTAPVETNISSGNQTEVLSGDTVDNLQQGINESEQNFRDVNEVVSSFIDTVRKIASQTAQMFSSGDIYQFKESSAFFNPYENTLLSDVVTGDFAETNAEMTKAAREYLQNICADIIGYFHSHPAKTASFSDKDLSNQISNFINDGIYKHLVIASEEIMELDYSQSNPTEMAEFTKRFTAIREKMVEMLFHQLTTNAIFDSANTDSSFETEFGKRFEESSSELMRYVEAGFEERISSFYDFYIDEIKGDGEFDVSNAIQGSLEISQSEEDFVAQMHLRLSSLYDKVLEGYTVPGNAEEVKKELALYKDEVIRRYILPDIISVYDDFRNNTNDAAKELQEKADIFDQQAILKTLESFPNKIKVFVGSIEDYIEEATKLIGMSPQESMLLTKQSKLAGKYGDVSKYGASSEKAIEEFVSTTVKETQDVIDRITKNFRRGMLSANDMDSAINETLEELYGKMLNSGVEELASFARINELEVWTDTDIEELLSKIRLHISDGLVEWQGLQQELSQFANSRPTTTPPLLEGNQTPLSSDPIKDTFQGDAESTGMEKVAVATDEAIQAKKDFATANEGVQTSVDGSKPKLKLESELMEEVAKSTDKATKAKDKYSKRNKISDDNYTNQADYYASIANQKLSSSGYTILGENVNTELLENGLVKVTAKIKTTEGTWKSFSAKIDADGNMFEQRFTTITKGVDRLEKELRNFGLDTSPALTYGETLEKANEVRNKLNLGNEYSIKVDSNGVVTITKMLSELDSTATSVTQTFKSAQDAIENFGREASNTAEKTTVALKSVKTNTNAAKSTKDLTEQQKIYEKLNKAINRYATVSKRIASNNAIGSDIEEAEKLEAEIKKLQKQPLLTKEQVDKSQSRLEELKTTLKDLRAITRETTLDSLQADIDRHQKTLDTRTATPNGINQSQKYKDALEELKKSIQSLSAEKKRLAGLDIITNEDLAKFRELEELAQKNADAFKAMTAAEKGSTEGSRWKEIDKISKYLDKNTKISKEAKQQLEEYLKILQSNDPSVNVNEIHAAWTKVAVAERRAGREGKSFFDIFKEKKIYNLASKLATYYLSLYDFIRYARYAVNAVIEIDTALTELRKVSDATDKRLEESFKNSTKTAKELGSTINDVISATADWSRMGYTVDQSEELARVSTLYVNVGDGIEMEEANESLISTLQGFQIAAEESESIIDKFNEVANNFAIDSAGIGEALQRSAASFNAANTDLSKSIALITATRPQNWLNIWKHILRIYLIAIEVFITMHHNMGETTI